MSPDPKLENKREALSAEEESEIAKFGGLTGYQEKLKLEAGLAGSQDKKRSLTDELSRIDQSQVGHGAEAGLAEALEEKRLELADAALAASISEKKLELFNAERDASGAFKFKRFGRETQDLFKRAEGQERAAIEQRENGEFALDASQERRRLLVVNMGELDRFNKEGGGHAAGDAALTETARTIERIVRDRLRDKPDHQADYTLLRYDANEFMVDFSDIDEQDFQEIMAEVNAAKPRVEGVAEAAPVAAVGLNFKDAVGLLNESQLAAGSERLDAGEDAARELVDLVKNMANHSLEKAKFAGRIQRLQTAAAEQGVEHAAKIFENYLKKGLSNVEGLKEDPAGAVTVESILKLSPERTRDLAEEAANIRIFEARRVNKVEQEIIQRRLKARADGRPKFEEAGEDETGEKQRIAKIPEGGDLKGLRRLAELKESADAAGEGKEAELLRLEYEVERTKSDASTGLQDRGVHYENLGQALKEGKDVSVVFVDMAFLKYFDQKGGTEIGDAATRLAAQIMEQAIEEAGVEGRAFRYGGDEYTLQIDGGMDEVAKVMKKIAELRDAKGRVPRGPRSQPEYAPTKLNFNTGSCDTAFMEQVFEDLATAGRLDKAELEDDPERLWNVKADLMTKIADMDIEQEKAVSRFKLLIGERRDPAYQADALFKSQVDARTDFSKKAIFAEQGGKDKLDAWVESGRSFEDLESEIRAYVDRQAETAHNVWDNKRELVDRMIEVHAKIRDLEQELGSVRQESSAKDAKIINLAARLEQANRERELLISTRGRMDEAYRDTGQKAA
ncbi:MAG: diguanylate cyclase [Patescibacteria group bacterium]|jgi:GGDEF domain-containing protein